MTGGVAHNLNNVLAAIMAAASARQILTKSPEDLAVYKFIDSACKRGRDVVRSLLHFARPNLSQASPVDLNALTAELSKLLEGTNQSRIRIVQDCSSESLWVSGNIGTLSSALLNLCLNAMDALPNAGTLTLRTMIPEKDWVGVTVEDNGEGMSPEILAKALDPFFTTKDVGKGTGLGLSMAYGVITAHGGTMEISSQPGQGTTVTIRLPRIPAPVQAAVMQPEAPDLGSLSILLVDDDENVRILAAMMFKAGGLAADYAEGGEEALEYLRTHDLPDLIILDQNMPVMDGAETMEAIRVLHPDLPILISSGRMDIEDWECFKRPNVAVLSKPFELAELRAKLATMDLQPRRRP
jgi:CheY-like chemotaxis protein